MYQHIRLLPWQAHVPKTEILIVFTAAKIYVRKLNMVMLGAGKLLHSHVRERTAFALNCSSSILIFASYSFCTQMSPLVMLSTASGLAIRISVSKMRSK